MTNDAPAPYARGGEVVPAEVMLFKVTKPLAGKDTSALPDRSCRRCRRLNPRTAVRERIVVADGNGSAFGRVHDDWAAGWKALGRSDHGRSEGGVDGDLVVCECYRGRASDAHSPGEISGFESAGV